MYDKKHDKEKATSQHYMLANAFMLTMHKIFLYYIIYYIII